MKKKYLILTVLIPLFYWCSFVLISNYTGGDQFAYRALYDSLATTDFWDVIEISKIYISAEEPLSLYILWAGSYFGFDKDIFISSVNTGLLVCVFLLAKRYRVNAAMLLLVFSNYYLIVLLTGAERLKFSMLFVLISALVSKRSIKIVAATASVFSHLQTLILFGSLAMGEFYFQIRSSLMSGRRYIKSLVGLSAIVIGFLIVVYAQREGLESKVGSYLSDKFLLSEVIQILIFCIAGLYFIKDKIRFALSIVPLALLTTLIGGARVNMIAVFVGVYLFWREGKSNHPFLYVLMMYFSLKTIPFVQRVMIYGDGFYGG
jgi:hypothetical protein